jgi:hypothetical protein
MNNGSNNYSAVGPTNMIKLIGRKKSYERLMRLDQQLYNLYKNNNGSLLSNPVRGVNSYSLKQKSSILGSGGYYSNHNNYSVLSGAGIGDLDIQGKSVVNSKSIINNSYM